MTILLSVFFYHVLKTYKIVFLKLKKNPKFLFSKFTTTYKYNRKNILQTKQDQYFEENKLFFSLNL